MQIVAGIVLSWVHNPSKAGNELFHRTASALDRTPKLQPCPLHRNACLQAPAPYAIALMAAHPLLDIRVDCRYHGTRGARRIDLPSRNEAAALRPPPAGLRPLGGEAPGRRVGKAARK